MTGINAAVIKKAANGDEQAIEQICISTWEPLYRFVYYKVQNREEAEDITQETYVKALAYLQEHEILPEMFLGFLKTIALNTLRDRWRQRRRRGIIVDFDKLDPEASAITEEQRHVHQRLQIEEALARLNEEQRIIIDLRIIKGYSVAKTARSLNKTEAAVRTAQYRALQAMAKILEKND